jgi:hypothetical protein
MKHSILECVDLIYFLTLIKKLKINLVKNKFDLKNVTKLSKYIALIKKIKTFN